MTGADDLPRIPAGTRTGGQFTSRSRAEARLHLDDRLGPPRFDESARSRAAEQASAWFTEQLSRGVIEADAPRTVGQLIDRGRAARAELGVRLAGARLTHDRAAVAGLEARGHALEGALSSLATAVHQQRLEPGHDPDVWRTSENGALLSGPDCHDLDAAWFTASARDPGRALAYAALDEAATDGSPFAADLLRRRRRAQTAQEMALAGAVLRGDSGAEHVAASIAVRDAAIAIGHRDLVDDPRLCRELTTPEGAVVRTGWTRDAHDALLGPWRAVTGG
ncbi:hypothetical protein CHO01_22950 [Cellulomonas hominis]|uniref:Uncharacterized protein n=1 Tax=Cellulomonas hominis TaxID=156981 RepID=A0A511FD36_9CELL|nr:hypothetical protein [Cellulomonas hominis]MBB5474624.1 hypothetical protein [Cellulomonas hominis]NKY06263.1 hypothetical protein [Cellulomonas hominis]GEL47179.1 hypothetical protein CHO01_22950 [Cellulomonas hominis]